MPSKHTSPIAEVPLWKYVHASQRLDTTGIDWDSVGRHPLDLGARDCLVYMADIEGFTVSYLRDVLNTAAIDDPEIARFLTLWAYEELFHQEALTKFLAGTGTLLVPTRMRELRAQRTARDRLMMWSAAQVSKMTDDFVAVYLTWGAINELSTLTAYGLLARRAGHPVLAELLARIIKDERRHFSFYYQRARTRLQSRGARRLTSMMVKLFWQPVGEGVKSKSEIEATLGYCFAGDEGLQAARDMDATIARLPGLEWFRRWEELWRRQSWAQDTFPVAADARAA